MSLLARQPELLRQLRAPEGRTLRDLSARLGVSKATVQRDLDRLSSAEFQIHEEPRGQTLLYRLEGDAPSMAGERAPLRHDELLPLLAALRPWRRTAWFKALRVRLAPGLPAGDLVDSTAPEPRGTGGALNLRRVVRGLVEHRRVRLTYATRGFTTTFRVTVEPARLRAAGGLLYLDAHLVPGGELRTFALHRVREAVLAKQAFTPRPLGPRTAFGATEAEPVDVVVRFAAPVAEFIRERRWHPSERVEALADGSLRWRATVSGEHEFLGWVLSWAPWAELEGPAPWREALAARARAMARTHARPLPRSRT